MPCKFFPPPTPPVHFFYADITELSAGDWMASQLHRLDQASLSRAADITHVRRREQFCHGRILLKHALAHVYGETVSGWRLDVGHGGKPFLLGRQGPAGVSLSLSHSGRWVVCALAECETLGIDIERCKPRDFPALSVQVMTPAERAYLAGLTPEGQAEFFYQCWTAKEACAKALGAEQAPAFNRMEVRLPDGSISEESGDGFHTGLCWGDGEYVTTLICKGAFSEVEVFHLDADGYFQPRTLKGWMPIRVRLQDTF